MFQRVFGDTVDFTKTASAEETRRRETVYNAAASKMLAAKDPTAMEMKRLLLLVESHSAAKLEQHQVHVGNGRAVDAGLNTTGFQLLLHKHTVTNWLDQEEVAAKYYDDIAEFTREQMGAARAFCNSHVVRGPHADAFGRRKPFPEVHNDYCEGYAEALAEGLSSDSEAQVSFGLIEKLKESGITPEELRESRLVMINAWRNISQNPLRRDPLVVADRRTVGDAELVRHDPFTLNGTGNGLEVMYSKYSSAHRFYWHPDMTKDEVLLFKGFDSEDDKAVTTLHCSCPHPDTPDGEAPRESVEVRVLCLLPKTKMQLPSSRL